MTKEIFVGREAQLAQLESELAQALQGQGRIVFVTGKPGAGKSLLLAKFVTSAQATHPEVLVSLPRFGRTQTKGELLRIWDNEIRELERKNRQRGGRLHQIRQVPGGAQKLMRGLGRWGGALGEVVGLFISGWLGSVVKAVLTFLERKTTAQGSGGELPDLREVLTKLEQVARRSPLIIALDDFHKADENWCTLLDNLGQHISDWSILLLVAFRPLHVGEDHPLYEVWVELTGRLGGSEIRLDELTEHKPSVRRFVRDYLNAAYEQNDFSEDFIELIARRTDGLPWFVDRLLNFFEEKGWIGKVGGRWTQIALPDHELPEDPEVFIRGTLWTRLSSEDQRRLSAAAVEGDRFTVDVLAEALDEASHSLRERLDNTLGPRMQWVRPAGSIRLTRQTLYQYRFWHTFYHEFTCRELSKSGAALSYWHGRVGAAKKKIWGAEWTKIAGVLADHFRLGGNQDEARVCYEHYLEELKRWGHHAKRIPVLLKLADTLRDLQDADGAVNRYQEAADLACQLGAELEYTRALEGVAWTLFDEGRFGEGLPAFEKALASYSVHRASDFDQKPSRRLMIGLSVAQLAVGQKEMALAALDHALEPDENDRGDNYEIDVQDARHWLNRLLAQAPETPGILQALERLPLP